MMVYFVNNKYIVFVFFQMLYKLQPCEAATYNYNLFHVIHFKIFNVIKKPAPITFGELY